MNCGKSYFNHISALYIRPWILYIYADICGKVRWTKRDAFYTYDFIHKTESDCAIIGRCNWDINSLSKFLFLRILTSGFNFIYFFISNKAVEPPVGIRQP